MKIQKWTSLSKNIKWRKLTIYKKEGELKMATQIAPTPILYGEEARKVLLEAKTEQSEKAKKNAKKLMNYFSRFVIKGE